MICQFIVDAIAVRNPNSHLISIDEKTGIQAIERNSGIAPKSKGAHRRIEYEYTRHGTTTLIAANNVENGRLIHHKLGPTRDEQDYADFVKATVSGLPEMDQIVILSDQLNTHVSESLVRWIAQEEQYDQDLGVKGSSGILKSMDSRRAFLETEHHRIRFVFTPKHCSWLNPIENWFAKLQRHVIKNGNFSHIKELQNKIIAYIDFYNQELAKPIKWKFKGFNKNKIIVNKL